MNDLQIFENHEFGQVRTVELDSRIDQLKIVAFGLPAFDQIMAHLHHREKGVTTMRNHTPPVPSTPFMNVRDAARATGLSEYYLRKELDKGTIPHIKSGRCIMINVPALLVQLGVPQK